MSGIQLVESLSSDPTERAIADRVLAILNNPSLSRAQRETLVRQAQRDLIGYRRHKGSRERLLELARAVPITKGAIAISVQVRSGRLQVGVTHPQQGFTWIDAGGAPPEFGPHVPAIAMIQGKAGSRGRTAAVDPIAARRRELGTKS